MATSSVHHSLSLRKRLGASRGAVQLPLVGAAADVRRPPAWPDLPPAARAAALAALAELLASAALNEAQEENDRD